MSTTAVTPRSADYYVQFNIQEMENGRYRVHDGSDELDPVEADSVHDAIAKYVRKAAGES